MKPLQWDRVLNSSREGQNSIWKNIQEPTIREDEFVDMFQKKTTTRKPKAVKKEPEVKMLLDPKSFQGISIMLKRVPKVSKTQQAVLEMDDKVLPMSTLDLLIQNLPSDDVVQSFQTRHKEKELSDYFDAEKYMLMMISIPEYALRLKTWKFVLEFDETVDNLSEPLGILGEAVDKLKDSKNFQKLLGYILALGNYMNGSNSKKGQADGFNLKLLSKIDMTKDRTNKVSLLKYLVLMIYETSPDTLGVIEELKVLHKAREISFERLQGMFDSLDGGFKKFKANVSKVQKHEDKNCSYMKRMMEFISDAQSRLETQENRYQEVKQKFFEMLQYFAFKKRVALKMEPSDFFAIVSDFLRKADAYKQEVAKLKKTKVKKRNARGQGEKITGGIDGMVDQITKELKARS